MKKLFTNSCVCMCVVAALFTSCKKQDLTEESLSKSTDENSVTFKISVDSLKKQALSIGSMFYDNKSSAKSSSQSVKSITNINHILMTKGFTKVTNYDANKPQAYVINFDNNEGFAILADDKRLYSNVLAYSDSGSIDEATDNQGVLSFIEDINAYFAVFPPQDYIIEVAPTEMPFSAYRTDRSVTPSNWGVAQGECFVWRCPEPIDVMVKGKMLNVGWHTAWPYNAALGNEIMTMNAEVATIAIAQLMSYYRMPGQVTVDGMQRTIDWGKAHIGDILSSNIPYLIKFINSSITDDNIPQILSNHGYLSSASVAFDESIIISELKDNRPVLAFAVHVPDPSGYLPWDAKCHWVIDGYIISARSTKVIDYLINQGGQAVIVGQRIVENIDMWQPYYVYYHCNWGWGGKSNGYFIDMTNFWQSYKFDSYNTNNNSIIKYVNNRRIITQIKPR